MIYCCNCRKLSSNKSKYCVRCKNSFGGRLCDKGHLSPTDARCCRECGSSELAKPVRSLNLHLPMVALALIIALVCLKVLLVIFPWLLQLIISAIDLISSFIFGKPILSIFFELLAITVVSAWLLFCFSIMLPANMRTSFWRAALPVVRWTGRSAIYSIKAVLRLFLRLVSSKEDRESTR